MAGDRPVLMGLLLYIVVALAPTLLFWAALRVWPHVTGMVFARRQRRVPPAPPLEVVVADLRRLRREMRGRPQHTQVRHLALLAAYDETLVQVCGLVRVEAPLAAAVGSDRAFARLLTEAALEDAGVALDPPAGNTAAA